MKITFKLKHNTDFTRELALAKKVAEHAIAHKDDLTVGAVSHLGLPGTIASSIIWKYGRNKKAKRVSSVPLTVRGDAIKMDGKLLKVNILKFSLELPKVLKVKQMELDKTYAYITHEVEEKPQYLPKTHIGVDLNTTGHCAVVAVKETGKVYKLGKKAEHIHKKYSKMRKNLQKKGLYGVVKKIKHRESNIIKDLNHKISRKIIDLAVASEGGVTLEKLQGIRKRSHKNFRYALNSWSYYQLATFIEYKALLAGVPISYVNPAYTSKSCSRCGLIGERNDKLFKCPNGHADHADSNAAFNIALLSPSMVQLQADRDARKGRIGRPQKATSQKQFDLKSKSISNVLGD